MSDFQATCLRSKYHPLLSSTKPGKTFINVSTHQEAKPGFILTLITKVGISKITKDQAMLLPNKTWPIPGDEEHYVAELDVFHNLHCLVRATHTVAIECRQ